jgi:hypothetical protein
MIHFVVVTGTPTAVERESRRLWRALETTRLQDGERIEHIGTSRTWAVAAISSADRVCRARLAVDGDAMVVANGPLFAATGDHAHVIVDLLQRFRASGSDAVAAALGGSYNFVGIDPSIGVRALVDFSGLSPLYWHQAADFAVFSNRSTTIGQLLSNEWDVRALAWVIGHANLFDDQLPAKGVSYLPPGREARVAWGETQVRVTESSTWVWPLLSDERGRDNLEPGEWDEITERLVANFRALRELQGPLGLSITGGKDSRLCLALAQAAGLRDHLETTTAGTIDSPRGRGRGGGRGGRGLRSPAHRATGEAVERGGSASGAAGATLRRRSRVAAPSTACVPIRGDRVRLERPAEHDGASAQHQRLRW